MRHNHKTDTIFFNFFAKCFGNKRESVSETKIIFFKKKCFNLENICEMKVSSKQELFFFSENVFIWKTFAKRKCFRNESKIVLVCETFFCFLFFKKMPETKTL